jgi:competence/damage-inducible protein CinA-like protein
LPEPIRRVAILSTGEELVRGAIADTNAPYMAGLLRRLGANVVEVRQVGDGREAIAQAAAELAARCDLLLVTGGIGPTADDRTREAIADAAAVGVREEPAALAEVEAYFQRVGRTPSASNRQQARLPAGATVVRNPVGSAPGFSLTIGGALVVVLPGVPGEMRAMVAASVLPLVRARNLELGGETRLLQVVGLPESVVGERIDAWMRRREPPLVSVTVAAGCVTICAADTADAAGRSRLDECVAGMRTALGDHLFAEGDVTLAAHVVERLRALGRSVALAESCTGGLVAAALTDVPGSSDVFLESSVVYANEAKLRTLAVPEALLREHGAVSEAVARAMAEGVRRASGATFGVSTTGIAGPGGGTPEKPVGLVHFAVAGPGGVTHLGKRFPGDRAMVRSFAVTTALDLLRRALGCGPPPAPR